jgi:hemerythrin superfamily protein
MPQDQDKAGLIVNAAKSIGSAAGKIASRAGLAPAGDAISLLKQDHDKVKQLFERFQESEDEGAKNALAQQALTELKVHTALEEELFYPAVRAHAANLINEADEEHHVVKLLIAEIEQMGVGDDHYDAKFTVLAENVRHHIREEEDEIFPRARRMDTDWQAVGQTMQRRKEELSTHGVPAAKPPRKAARRAPRKKKRAA